MTTETNNSEGYKVAQGFMEALGAMDMDRMFELWADDGVMEIPFQANGLPKELVGKEAFMASMGRMPESFSSFTALDVDLLATSAPGRFVVEWRSEAVFRASGAEYNQLYICIIQVRDGKVVLFREYNDPQILVAAMG